VVESDARDGIGVSVLVNGMLAETGSVPDFDLVIASTGKDLGHLRVGGEGNGEDISGVTEELSDSLSGLEVPKSDGTIPRGGEAMLAVGVEADLVDEVRVTGVHAGGSTPLSVFLVVVVLVIKVPLDKGLITRSRDEELNLLTVSLFFSESEGGNPTSMSLKVTLLLEDVLGFLFHFDHCVKVFVN
jgi:hypothetical protein